MVCADSSCVNPRVVQICADVCRSGQVQPCTVNPRFVQIDCFSLPRMRQASPSGLPLNVLLATQHAGECYLNIVGKKFAPSVANKYEKRKMLCISVNCIY